MAEKHWLAGHFSVAMAPEDLHPGRAPSLPRKVKAVSKQLLHRFLFRRELVIIGLSGIFLDPTRGTP